MGCRQARHERDPDDAGGAAVGGRDLQRVLAEIDGVAAAVENLDEVVGVGRAGLAAARVDLADDDVGRAVRDLCARRRRDEEAEGEEAERLGEAQNYDTRRKSAHEERGDMTQLLKLPMKCKPHLPWWGKGKARARTFENTRRAHASGGLSDKL